MRSVAWRALVFGLGVLALVTPVQMLAPLFVPPPRYPAEQARIANRLDASFGDQVALLGYDVGSESFGAGDEVDVTVYLRAEHPITESLTLWLQLVSAAPGDDSKLSNLRSWPGGGNYPTTAWRPGEVLADRYQLLLPHDVAELQLWELRLLFSQPAQGEREYELLPVRVGGVPGDSYVTLSLIRVEPSREFAVLPPTNALLHTPPTFGPEQDVVLEAAQIVPGEAGEAELSINLWWRVHNPLDSAYVVFVQLLDEEGNLVASGDGPPRGGAMPTKYWRSGDLIVDRHIVPLSEDLLAQTDASVRTYSIGVGLYSTDGRLPAWDSDGQLLPEARAIIGTWR